MDSNPITQRPRFQSICQQLAGAISPIATLRQANKASMAELHQRFGEGAAIEELVLARAARTDELLAAAWQWCQLPLLQQSICLIAVGGYGRGELHPHSDVDLLILIEEDSLADHQAGLEQFITLLWDIKLNIGHSVRTIAQCVEAATDDITVATSLMEARLLLGQQARLSALSEATGPQAVWPSPDFYRAKWEEQFQRHRKFADTEYRLEPNIKSCPGGLRDVQTIAWIAKRHFQTTHIDELLTRDFLTSEEFDIMNEGRNFLWRVRWGLHMITDRAEDRLLFEHQQRLAEIFHYSDSENGLAIEQFMQVYYRWALALNALNELVVQLYDEAILRACDPENTLPISQRFYIRNHYIDVCNDRVFQNTPTAIMEIFVLMANNPNIIGLRASTIRLLRESWLLIDDAFRADPRNRQFFVALLRAPHKIATQLQRMSRYGVLSRYLPEFGRIVGKMQHDLFHIYTVDAHTLQVVKNLRLFAHEDFTDNFPLAAGIIQRMPKRELLYVAALYHDIAKGRGGNHSEKGALDADRFCHNHGFTDSERALVVWLVKNHLIMSSTSQRQDISDPEVIHAFAEQMGDQLHLDALYLLTVADINATAPKLWTSWRASLMRHLYLETRRALRRDPAQQPDKGTLIEAGKENAIRLLEEDGYDADEIIHQWDSPGEDYFLRETPADIAWHTRAIMAHCDNTQPLILMKNSTRHQAEGATQIFFYTRSQPNLFALTAATIEQLHLNIQDARIYRTSSGFSMDTYFVLESNGAPIDNASARFEEIHQALQRALTDGQLPDTIFNKRISRRLQYFDSPTEVKVSNDSGKQCTVIEVSTPDRPGVLARIGRVFLRHGIALLNAKISTLGERVEDIFFVLNSNGQPLWNNSDRDAITAALCAELDQRTEPSSETIHNI